MVTVGVRLGGATVAGVAGLAALATVAGVLLTAANRWGTAAVQACRDTVTVLALCAAPQSPLWALALGGLIPAVLIVGAALLVLRYRH